MKDLTEFSEKQSIRFDNYIRRYGICYLEEKEGSKIRDVVIKKPTKIIAVTDTKMKYKYDSDAVRESLNIRWDINEGNHILIQKLKLTWFQKLLLKIAGLI